MVGSHTLETGYERNVGCSITGITRTFIRKFEKQVRVGEVRGGLDVPICDVIGDQTTCASEVEVDETD